MGAESTRAEQKRVAYLAAYTLLASRSSHPWGYASRCAAKVNLEQIASIVKSNRVAVNKHVNSRCGCTLRAHVEGRLSELRSNIVVSVFIWQEFASSAAVANAMIATPISPTTDPILVRCARSMIQRRKYGEPNVRWFSGCQLWLSSLLAAEMAH